MGPSDRHLEVGRRHLRDARGSAFSARAALAAFDESAEDHARLSLQRYASAMNWLEDTADFDVAHGELHEIGRLCREEFSEGCRYGGADGDFVQSCPAALVHTRVGFSPGMIGNAICSVCDEDVTECPHRPGETIPVEALIHPDGRCSICGSGSCVAHVPGLTYSAEVGVVVTEVYEIEEVSIVDRPRQPDARIQSVRIPRADIERRLGQRIPLGAHMNCDRCLGQCRGFSSMRDLV